MLNCLKKDCIEAGLDEAGRGPLFGPVYVGCVILDPNETYNPELIKDSKKLNPRKRLIAYDYVKENAIDYSIFSNDEKVVDKINILQATYKGMHGAINKLRVYPDHLLIDGTYFIPYFNVKRSDYLPHTCVKSGDNKYYNIAAASILAKVSRDKYIEKLCDDEPTLEEYYGIRGNKGYGAKRHIDGINTHGITKWHRRSFGLCKNYN
jgi:ribonuclease HII